jgi:hypothetical protein
MISVLFLCHTPHKIRELGRYPHTMLFECWHGQVNMLVNDPERAVAWLVTFLVGIAS